MSNIRIFPKITIDKIINAVIQAIIAAATALGFASCNFQIG